MTSEKSESSGGKKRVLTAARYLQWISLSSIVATYPGDIYIMLTPNEDPSLFNVTTLSPFLSLSLSLPNMPRMFIANLSR